MNKLDILTKLHTSISRDYLSRMNNNKVECMNVASLFEFDYWDGDRKFGYGGYKYDGRWKPLAEALIEKYSLTANSKILDVGCGMGHLIFELKKELNCDITGIDISQYAYENSPISQNIVVKDIREKMKYDDNQFDLVISIMTLHNFHIHNLEHIIKEIERIAQSKYIAVESFRNNQELFNLQCWALTCNCFLSPESWSWMFKQCEYTGDYEYLFFE